MRNRSLVLLLALVASSCVVWPEGTGPKAPPMPLEEALARRDRGEAVIVDVRSAAAFARGHVRGAVNVPGSQMESRFAEIRGWGKLPILYCG